MQRISRPTMFFEMAQVVAKRSTCFRLNVGAVIVHNRRIISIGYNGTPAGAPHCSGHTCPGAFTCRETTHAEANAINHMPSHYVSDLDMYVTDSPCAACWDKISNGFYKFDRVFFGTPYRLADHLKDPGINNTAVYRITPAGYVIDWATGGLIDIET